ncbi:tetratricopeptide repeat protein [Actinomadura sp. HBU206391]|uniref:tetratricopeptide repeat protein n=1 Tax=Actinomadura sp. HBU206391 TaxID=2731692 RepID=UPI00164EFEC9|nr:tetratricopeptide repeat protein [Actinomadura sp. HBU206391]MBC6457859.1 sel1 repeat family protein [Actinomadura sp. HBU206391]
MSIDEPWNGAALDEFIKVLEEFRRACGGPGIRELARVSRQVVETSDKRYRHLQMLSPTALSDVLNRRRKKPPPWSWVASYVLSCQRYAAESGLIPHDPGGSTLPEWNRRLQAVYATGENPTANEEPDAAQAPDADQDADPRTGRGPSAASPPGEWPAYPQSPPQRAPSPPAPSPPASPPPASPPPSPSPPPCEPLAAPTVEPRTPARDSPDDRDSPPGSRAAPRAAAQAVIVELLEDYVGDPGGPSLSELRFFKQYGRHGVDLLTAAESHQDPEACFRLGLLLCMDDRPTESLAWLMQAERHGHPGASRLIEHPSPRAVAPAFAYELGAQAATAGDHATAELYLERAVGHGHARAAFELGALSMERQDPARAVFWFSRAAECGHPLAQWWSDRLHHETRREGISPPPPLPEHAISLPSLADLISQVHRARPYAPER